MQLGEYIFSVGLDDAKFKKGMANTDKSIKDFGKKATQTGKTLTKNLTLPIVGLGTAAVKMAADFEVASRKFAGAFQGAEEQASAAVENLNENFGLATSQATQLLAFTGDLLKGFGATSEEALGLANSTNELAAALSAYNGVPVAQASEAVTKALLGERESLKLLGVAIRETDVQNKLLEKGQADLTGQALLLAKAEATLELAYEQSADAVNNFAENTDTLSFQSQALLADLKDLAVEFGTILLPVIKDVVGAIREGVEWFGNLDESQKLAIVKMAALVAAIGPAIQVVGTLTTAVAGLQSAFTFLAANPVVATIAGIAAVTTAVVALGKKAQEKHIQDLADQFGELATATGVADDEMKDFLKDADTISGALAQAQGFGSSFEDVEKQVGRLSRSFGLTIEQVTEIGIRSGELNQEYVDMLTTIKENEAVQRDLSSESLRQEQLSIRKTQLAERQAQVAEEARAEEEKITAELEAQNAAREAAIQATIDARVGALEAYGQEIRDAQTKYNLGLITERELLEENLKASEAHADALIEAGYDGADASSIGNRELQNQKQLIIDLKAQLGELDAVEQERLEAAEEAIRLQEIEKENNEAIAKQKADIETSSSQRLFELNASKMEILEAEYEAEIAHAEAVGADTQAIEEYYSQMRLQLRMDEAQQIIGLTSQYASQIGSIFDGIYQAQINYIDSEVQKYKEAYADEAQAKIDALDQQTMSQEEYAAAVDRIKEQQKQKEEALEKEAAMMKYNIELKAFKAKRTADIATTIMNTAVAIIKGYAQLGPIGGSIAAIATAATAAAQLAVIKTQPPPERPQLAEGGIVNPRAGGVPVTIGEAGDSEAVIPLNDRFFNRLSEAATGATTGSVGASNNSGSPVVIQNVLDGKIISETVVGRINNNTPGTQIRNTAIVNR